MEHGAGDDEVLDREEKQTEDQLRHQRVEERRWDDLGPQEADKVEALAPPISCEAEVVYGTPLSAWFLDSRVSQATYSAQSLLPGKVKPTLDFPDPHVSIMELRNTGIGYWKVLPNDYSVLNQICRTRVYKQMDEIMLHQIKKDEALLEKWFTEQFHANEQLLLLMEGSAYLDIRHKSDVWVRLQLTPGDLVCIPPGLFHRFTLDENDYAWVMRLLRDSARWLPIFRTERKSDAHAARLQYQTVLRQGPVADATGFMPSA